MSKDLFTRRKVALVEESTSIPSYPGGERAANRVYEKSQSWLEGVGGDSPTRAKTGTNRACVKPGGPFLTKFAGTTFLIHTLGKRWLG